MTKQKSTKRALLLSALSLLMCVSMLIGSTFAWFTDSVTSGNNKIVSGNLDVELYHSDKAVTDEQVSDTTKLFDDITLWEPGAMVWEKLTVKNLGSLVLKYTLTVNVSDVSVVNGKSLADVLKVAVLNVQPTRENIVTAATKDLATFSLESNKELEAYTGVDEFYVAIYWAPSANDNDYNVAGEQLYANLGVTLVATQATYESDSFNDQYDAGAKYPVVPAPEKVSSANTFAEISTLLAEGKDIYVAENIDLTNTANGNTYLTVNEDVAIYAAEGTVVSFNETALINGSGSITVYGGTLKTNYELCVTGDAKLIIEGGEHSFGAFSATGNGKIVVNGGTLNCRGTYAGVMGISFAENGQLIVNDGNLNMYQPFNLNANRCDAAYIEINGGTIDLLNGIENLFVVRNIMDKDKENGGVLRGSSIRVNGGTFIAHYEIDSAGDATSFIRNGDAPADTNKVLVSNSFNGAPDYDCVVTGGTFYGSWQRADNQRYTNGSGGHSDGLFVENSIAGFVAAGYEITGDATNGYVVSAK